jgi:hypothetical protein
MKVQMMSVSRRSAMLGGAAAVAMIPIGARAQLAPVIQSGGGIAGGGSIAVQGGGTANFSVFGSRFEVEGQDQAVFFGSLNLVDSDGTQISSTEITKYAPVEGDENSREMTGFAALNDEGRYLFSLKLTDAGSPGGDDSVQLSLLPDGTVATPSAAEAAYAIDGTLETGDLQLLTFDFGE